jgi:glycosyltransferase involved in cell wall biosynthesis
MKVLHILNELKPSGAEVMLRVAAPHWQKECIESHVLSTGAAPGIYSNVLAQAGYKMHHLSFSKSPYFFISLYKLLRHYRFDAVHIHTERASLPYALVARSAEVKTLVRTVHSVFAFEGAMATGRRLQRMLSRKLGVHQVSISPSVTQNEARRFQNPTTQIMNWYSERFQPVRQQEQQKLREQFGIPESAFVVLSVGNCSSVKNHTELIVALARIKPKLDFVYLHLGQENPSHDERQMVQDLNIADRVRFLGFVDDVLPYLHIADAYVMPSLHEGLGMAAIEAMAAGAPTILADVSGLTDLKVYTTSVTWVSPEATSIAEALLKLAALPIDARKQKGLQASNDIKHHFEVGRGARAYAKIYQSKSSC